MSESQMELYDNIPGTCDGKLRQYLLTLLGCRRLVGAVQNSDRPDNLVLGWSVPGFYRSEKWRSSDDIMESAIGLKYHH